MKIEIITEKNDIEKVHELLKNQEKNDLCIGRDKWNVKSSSLNFSKENFWHEMIGCLLSSQQKSGPKSAISKFLKLNPFPLSLNLCEKNWAKEYTEKALTEFRGIRFSKKIGEYVDENLRWLNSGGWQSITDEAEKLAKLRAREPMFEDIKHERYAANFINENFKGFGPKQSRNLWQELGYTRFEIPLDSRVVKWLNQNNIFPFKITSTALSDIHYYEMVLDWIQKLCKDANVLPCMLDAAIFSSYDSEILLESKNDLIRNEKGSI